MTVALRTNLVLCGYMGTGKTTVGRLLAAWHGRVFVDTDRLIEQEAGCDVAALFAREGEASFRKREKQAVRQAAGGRRQVIATGGGVPLDPENLQALSETGFLVLLTARPATLVGRLRGGKERPLLAGRRDVHELEEHLEERSQVYRRISRAVATDDLTAEQVARHVWALFEAAGPW